MSVRSDVAAQLEAAWAEVPELAGLRVIATERQLDDITRGTALIRQKTVEPNSAAPMSQFDVELLLTVIAPHTNLDAAADWLDGVVPAVLVDLRTRVEVVGKAECVDYLKQRLAYDIPLTVVSDLTP